MNSVNDVILDFYDPCKGCEYNGKPYWSVVSPCANCTKRHNIAYGSKTSNGLPTKQEYEDALKINLNFPRDEWSEPKYICDECGGNMRRNEMLVCTSYPPQYTYQCDKCGHIDFQYY